MDLELAAGRLLQPVLTVTLRQRIVPDRLLGRVNASYRMLAWGSQPLGALLGGAIGQALGLPAVFLLGGLVTASLLIVARTVTDDAIAAAESDPGVGRTATD